MKREMEGKMRQKNVLVFLLGSTLVLTTFAAITLWMGARETQCPIDEDTLNAERLEVARQEAVRQETIRERQEECNAEIARVKEEAQSRIDWLQRHMWYNQALSMALVMVVTVAVTRREQLVKTVVSTLFTMLWMGWRTLVKSHPRWNTSAGPRLALSENETQGAETSLGSDFVKRTVGRGDLLPYITPWQPAGVTVTP
ncbi:hypothetical protein FJT64_012794 [Amphibalanus amphitrite]|uniref:Uncharacterized protein n=1 Tax=Amphibalanus amphitrite TaxID=1232801 RepID=A0A6A4V2N4_AMPAM|nr:hypothetical protein FJT64_012794 [Amphibalanus amphitrite]